MVSSCKYLTTHKMWPHGMDSLSNNMHWQLAFNMDEPSNEHVT
uniref:Uncharacterized protein n=1 Tax=Arundo donax TaxID=35708 RepID=A0A0A9GV23_ARUDO